MTEALIYGVDGVSLRGKGNGYMELQLGKSAVRLGEYSHPCLTDLSMCKSGFTLSFWINFEGVQDGSSTIKANDIDIITLTSSKNSILLKIALSVREGKLEMFFCASLLLPSFVFPSSVWKHVHTLDEGLARPEIQSDFYSVVLEFFLRYAISI